MNSAEHSQVKNVMPSCSVLSVPSCCTKTGIQGCRIHLHDSGPRLATSSSPVLWGLFTVGHRGLQWFSSSRAQINDMHGKAQCFALT